VHTLIRRIDLDEGFIAAEVRQPLPLNLRENLGDFLGFCKRMGLLDVHLGFRKHRSMQTVMVMMALRKSVNRMTLNATSHDDLRKRAGARGRGENEARGSYGPNKVAEHKIRLCDMEIAAERIGQLVLLLGTSLALDDESLSMLRLCLYELASNTVEHAAFGSENPEIRVTLVTQPDRVEVVYRDNASRFSTTNHKEINIERKMKDGHKRGLGLFMLDKIAQDLIYQRHGDWNETTFTIARSTDTSEDYARRKVMTTLSMEVNSIKDGEAVVIKTKGSINSNTAPALDAEMTDLMDQNKYRIVIDLKETDFISSSGIGVLLGTVTTLRDNGGDLVLMNLPKIVGDIFDILNIRSYFRIIDNLDDLAVKSR
jgi:anti-sigma B factor antagonist